MSYAAKSVLVFGVYLGALGFGLVLGPDTLLTLLGLPRAEDYWILVAAMLLIGLGIYYLHAALTEQTSFMRLTAILRSLVLPYLVVLVLRNKAPAPILILGVIDLVFAAWTFLALRRDSRSELDAA